MAARYCAQCGRSLHAGARFCSNCATAVPTNSIPNPLATSSVRMHEAVLGTPRGRALLVVVVVGVAVLLALAFVPVSQGFSVTIFSGGLSSQNLAVTFPVGSHVSGTWKTADGGSVEFGIWATGQSYTYLGTGGFGSFSFVAVQSSYNMGTYSFPIPETTSVSGTYSAPLI